MNQDIIFSISGYLDGINICRNRVISSTWHNVAHIDTLWNDIMI